MTALLIKKGNVDTETHIGRKPREHKEGHLQAKEGDLQDSPSQSWKEPALLAS